MLTKGRATRQRPWFHGWTSDRQSWETSIASPRPAGPRAPRRSLLARWLKGTGQSALVVAARVTAVLIGIHVVLQLLVTAPLWPLESVRRLFDVGGEQNLPSFWNTALLVTLACSMWLLAGLLPATRRMATDRKAWITAGLVVAVMAADEAVALHEQAFLALGVLLEQAGITTPTFKWVLPGAVFAGIAVMLAGRWLVGLPGQMRRGLLVALVVYGTGALGVEAVSGVVATDGGIGRRYHMMTAVEESMEMGAVLWALRTVWNAFVTDGHDGRRVATTWPDVAGRTGP